MPVQRLRLEIEAATAYEFVLSLTTPNRNWDAPAELVVARDRFSGGSDMIWAHLLTIAHDAGPPRDVESFLVALGALHPRELRLRLLGYYVRYFRRATLPEVIAAAEAGKSAAVEQFLATSHPEDADWQRALRHLLPMSRWDTRRELIRILLAWRPTFDRHHEAAALAGEVTARRRLAQGLRPEQVVASVMDGWEYIPEPGINTLLLIPSRATWPLAHAFDHGSTKLICYPIGSAPDPGVEAPPPQLVAAGHALADERRLRILRQLASGDLPAQELSVRLGIGLTTLIHHLSVLTRSGLVEVGSGRRRHYRLRRDQVAAVGAGLERFLN